MMELARVDTWARRYDLAGRTGETRMQSGDKQKIRSRLRSYERKLQKEKREQGFYRDGAGKRYQIGPYYLLLGDNEGALAAFYMVAGVGFEPTTFGL